MDKFFSILLLIVIGCSTATRENINQLSWPTGRWINDWEDSSTVSIETWTITDQGIRGHGLTRTIDKDTLFFESLLIHTHQDDILYSVNLSSNEKSVNFTLTDMGENYWKFENPNHDFPQVIEYRVADDTLYATVSAEGRSLDFKFRKAQR